jgi:hypothetical protein
LLTVYESPPGQLVYTHQCANLPYVLLYESLYCIRISAYTRLRLYEAPLIWDSAPSFNLPYYLSFPTWHSYLKIRFHLTCVLESRSQCQPGQYSKKQKMLHCFKKAQRVKLNLKNDFGVKNVSLSGISSIYDIRYLKLFRWLSICDT